MIKQTTFYLTDFLFLLLQIRNEHNSKIVTCVHVHDILIFVVQCSIRYHFQSACLHV